MRILRNVIRKIKYNLKFLGKSADLDFSYIVNAKNDQTLKKLMDYYGSDKGGKNNHHNFTDYYSEIFYSKRQSVKNFLEVGLGTNNENIPSNMGRSGKPLASIRAWRDYFTNAQIFGADIDHKILKNETRITTHYVDQTDPVSIKKMYDYFGVDKFDVILEDGLHEFSANIIFFENSIDYLDEKGTYIIEDIYYKDQKKFINYFKKSNYQFYMIDIYHKQNIANNCLIIIKKNG
jgi:hypothetical protein